MIYLSPRRVTLGATDLTHVSSVTVDRAASVLTVEHSDLGPHVAFVDVPEQRITIRVVRTLVADEPGVIKPGQSLALSLRTAPSPAAPEARQIEAEVVVTGVEHDVTIKHGVRQTITCIAVSSDGSSDPITESIVAGGA